MTRPRFVQDFNLDFVQVLKADEPFAFARFHDGEYALLQGIQHTAKSGWSSDGPTWLQFPLLEALTEDQLEGYYIGISPPCDHSEAASWYRSKIKLKKPFVTFATLFQHANYKRLPMLLRAYKDPVLVACKNGDITVPQDGIRRGWNVDAVVEKLLKVEGRPVFVAAGPCANVIIHRYWQRQDPGKRVPIIDIGSILDPTIHGKPTRRFHDPNSDELRHRCDWEQWHAFQELSGKRLEREMRKVAASQTFRRLQDSGFEETVGGRERRKRHHRRAEGSTNRNIRDASPGVAGNRNIRDRKDRSS